MKKSNQTPKPIPQGKGNWRERREALLKGFVKPHLRCAQRVSESEMHHADSRLQHFGLSGSVTTDVMVVVDHLLAEVEKVVNFPDFIIDRGFVGRIRHDKYRRISYFTTFDGQNEIRWNYFFDFILSLLLLLLVLDHFDSCIHVFIYSYYNTFNIFPIYLWRTEKW